MLLAFLLFLKQLQKMPNHPNNRLLISGKLQAESLVSFAGIQRRESIRSTAIVRKISTLHGVWEVASNDILDFIKAIDTLVHVCIGSTLEENSIPHPILPGARRQETLIARDLEIQRQYVHLCRITHIVPGIRLRIARDTQRDI